MKKINESEYLTVVGFMTLLIQQRRSLDHAQRQCATHLKTLGAEDTERMEVQDWVGEAVYNQGDDPESSAKGLLSALEIEVE